MKTERPRRHVPKLKWRIEGEVEIGSSRRLIENMVPPKMLFIAAHSRAQAVKLLAIRFVRHFHTRVYLGDADVYQTGTLSPDQPPIRLAVFSPPKVPEAVQLSLSL